MVDTSTEAVTNLLDGVTPGPWSGDPRFSTIVAGEKCIVEVFTSDADAHFITAARDLVPALLAERDALAAAEWAAEADVARRLEMHECAMAERDDCIEDWSKANDRIKALEGALGWYAEQTSLCRLIHSEGDVGRNALANDGGDLARAALAASRAASDCQQRDLVTAEAAQPVTVQDTPLYQGPILVGMEFVWEPNNSRSRENIIVTKVVARADDETMIFSRIAGPKGLKATEGWNDESRFREAVVPAITVQDAAKVP